MKLKTTTKMEERLVERSMSSARQSREKAYRHYAGLSDNEPITEDNIDTYALNRTSCENNYDVHALRKDLVESILVEDKDDNTLGAQVDKLADDLDAVVANGETNDIIFNTLDWALDANLEEIECGGTDFKNVLFIGEAGTGKTKRIQQWARKNNINLFSIKAPSLDDPDIGASTGLNPDDAKSVIHMAPTQFDQLNKPNSVLFLDEFNRARDSVRGNLLTLITEHTVVDPRADGGTRFFPNFLFTIAAINPPTGHYNTAEMDRAEVDRFFSIYTPSDWGVWCKWMINELKERLARTKNERTKEHIEGRIGIVQHLYKSKEGVNLFDNPDEMDKSTNGLITGPRSLADLITGCNGTKEHFLMKWNERCSSDKKKLAELILKDYKDVADKANDALKKAAAFAPKRSRTSRLLDLVPDLYD